MLIIKLLTESTNLTRGKCPMWSNVDDNVLSSCVYCWREKSKVFYAAVQSLGNAILTDLFR